MAELATLRVTVARTLFGMVVELRPHTRQVAVPVPFVQDRVLLAAPDAGVMLADAKSAVE